MLRIYSMQNTTDTLLVESILNGNQEEYSVLIDRYKAAVYRHCFAVIRDEDEAKDIAQDTFIAAYYKLDSYDTKRPLATWLFKIATNKCLDALRKRKHEVALDENMAAAIVSEEVPPNVQALYTEMYTAIARLKPEYGICISLFYWQGLSIKDIAAVMNTRENTIKSWLRRAKEQLQEELR